MDRIRTTISDEIEVQHALHAKGRNGRCTIYLRFFILEKTIRVHEALLSTGITVSRDKWTSGGSIKGSGYDSQNKKERLRERLDIVRDSLHELKKLKIKNAAIIRQEIEEGLRLKITNRNRNSSRSNYLSKLGDHSLSAVKVNYLKTTSNISESYVRSLGLAIGKFSEWWNLQYSNSNPKISEVTTSDVKAYKIWLTSQISHNGSMTYLNRLRTVFNHSLENKLILETPIPKRGFIEGYKKGEQVALTIDELLKLEKFPNERLSETMIKTKNIFLFMCLTGMGYGELKSLRVEHVNEEGDHLIITKERNKTGIEFHVPLSSTAKNIYVNYISKVTNWPSIEYVSRTIKNLCKMAGITKNVTTYVGRKTFATQWVKDDNHLYYLSIILGHTNINTTKRYVQIEKSEMVKYGLEAYKKNAFHSLKS